MKTTLTIIALVLVTSISFGKTKIMTVNEYQLQVQKVDSSLVGTWEKTWTVQQKSEMEFCQFNDNGTYFSFTKEEKADYVITGKGTIYIVHGEEKGPGVSYKSNGSMLIFGKGTSYAKSTLMYVER